jgi:ABC-2 type transport system ATP-binding protein
VIEVEFDYKIEEQAIAKIENLISKNTHDMIWELTFLADKDMRPAVFDFDYQWFKNPSTQSKKI